MKLCPCGEGKIEGEYYDKKNEPKILCHYCSEVYKMKLFLCWDSLEGRYWYQWKAVLSE